MKIMDVYESKAERPLFICDFSPPRGASLDFLEDARSLDVDFISVNYSPGRVPRVDSAVTAHLIRQYAGRDVIFTLAVRDMNPLALQTHVLGAAALGLENLLILGGDPFPTSQLAGGLGTMRPTELMRAVSNMNKGLDRRGHPLEDEIDLCVGGVIDLGGDIETAARLTHRKVEAGAQFFVTQPVFDPQQKRDFESAYEAVAGEPLVTPVFYGLQILRPGSVAFSLVPPRHQQRLERGRSGEDIAMEVWEGLRREGIDTLYLVPPVGPRGARDYEAANRFLERVRT